MGISSKLKQIGQINIGADEEAWSGLDMELDGNNFLCAGTAPDTAPNCKIESCVDQRWRRILNIFWTIWRSSVNLNNRGGEIISKDISYLAWINEQIFQIQVSIDAIEACLKANVIKEYWQLALWRLIIEV